MVTVKPSVVAVGAPKMGLRAMPVSALAVTCAEPLVYPDLVVATVMVVLAPGFNPVTVKGSVDPLGVPTVTDPEETDGVKV